MKPQTPSIALITIDALSKDHLPIYGYPHDTAPGLRALARQSLVFDRMFSQFPCTPPAMAALMTGFYPSFAPGGWNARAWHGLSRFHSRPGEKGIPAALPTLAERLKGRGYDCAAFLANPFLGRTYGFARGFDAFEARAGRSENDFFRKRSADVLVAQALRWLSRRKPGRPFFLWLHLMDAHLPVNAGPFHRLFPHDYLEGRNIDAKVQQARLELELEMVRDGFNPDPGRSVRIGARGRTTARRLMNHYRGLYDGSIFFADLCLKRLFERLEDPARREPLLWAVTSDHGEEFLENGYAGHHWGSEGPLRLVQVPFILRLPDGKRGRVARLARHIDLAPTLLEWSGSPAAHLNGESLLPLLSRRPGPPRFQHLNLGHTPARLHLIYGGGFKYRYSPVERTERILDARTGRPLRRSQWLARFRAERDWFMDHCATRPAPQGNELRGAPSHLRQLRALGYVG